MNPDSRNQHLSRISTLWSLLHQAHAGSTDAVGTAQRLLMQRYCGAVYRYLLGALRDEDAAVELFQEFALRFLRGDFRRADPAKGRFRDYVKTALIYLVTEYRKAQRDSPHPLPPDLPAPTSPYAESGDTEFLDGWREELLARTWEALDQVQPTFHAVLLSCVEQPDLPSPRRAEELAAQLGKSFTAGNVRVTLHRAREKFADLLVEEVLHSLESATEAELIQELRELRLLKLCIPALKRRGLASLG
jgi:RNA polymerase sigma-70 factor (ECF subfamily)